MKSGISGDHNNENDSKVSECDVCGGFKESKTRGKKHPCYKCKILKPLKTK